VPKFRTGGPLENNLNGGFVGRGLGGRNGRARGVGNVDAVGLWDKKSRPTRAFLINP